MYPVIVSLSSSSQPLPVLHMSSLCLICFKYLHTFWKLFQKHISIDKFGSQSVYDKCYPKNTCRSETQGNQLNKMKENQETCCSNKNISYFFSSTVFEIQLHRCIHPIDIISNQTMS